MTGGSKQKIRLDDYLVRAGYFPGIKEAQSYIMQGKVVVDERAITKAGFTLRIPPEPAVRLKGINPNVSRAAGKLAGFVDSFGIDVKDRTVFDIGCAHGGFTQVALEHGAERVVMVDVARGQIAWPLRDDARTIVLERTHARSLHPGSFFADLEFPDFHWSGRSRELPLYAEWGIPLKLLFVVDVSFISIKEILPALLEFVRASPQEGIELIILFKPQFEVAPEQLEDGIVTRPQAAGKAMAALADFLRDLKTYVPPFAADKWPDRRPLQIHWTHSAPSTVAGRQGNREYLIRLEVRLGEHFDFVISDAAGELMQTLQHGHWA